MKKLMNKKGFTIVELVIVIAVIAILAAVLIPTFSNLIEKANISNDTMLVKNLNTTMTVAEIDGKPKTMHEALELMDKNGYEIKKLTPTSTNCDILWNSVTNRFELFNCETQKFIDTGSSESDALDYQKWIIVSEAVELSQQKYSMYLLGDSLTNVIETKVGVDTGLNAGITSINYTNTESAKDIVIRTTGLKTTVNINGYVDSTNSQVGDTISHYGYAGVVNVIKCAMASYDVYGTVGKINLTEGHADIKASSTVYQLESANNKGLVSIDENANVYYSDGSKVQGKVDKTDSEAQSKFVTNATSCTHTSTELVVDGKHVYEICKGCGNSLVTVIDGSNMTKHVVVDSENNPITTPVATYTKGEGVSVNENGVVITEGTEPTISTPVINGNINLQCKHTIWNYESIDSQNHKAKCSSCELSFVEGHTIVEEKCTKCDYTEKEYWSDRQKQMLVAPNGYDLDKDGNLTISSTNAFAYFAKEVNSGNKFTNKIITLDSDIDLENHYWTPINNFEGHFDGKDHTVSNLYVEGPREKSGYGLFGDCWSAKSIKNLKIHNVYVVGNSALGSLIGKTGPFKIENIHVTGLIKMGVNTKNGNIPNYNSSYVGGIVGHGYASVSNCTVIGDEGSFITDGRQMGGIYGFVSEGKIVIDNCKVENINISGTKSIGGICGWNQYGNVVTNCVVNNVSVTVTGNEQYTIGIITGTTNVDNGSPNIYTNNKATNYKIFKGTEELIWNNATYEYYGCYGLVAYAINENSTICFASLQEAINYGKGYDTIGYGSSVFKISTCSESIEIPEGRTITIDLNGGKLIVSDAESVSITNNGTLTLKNGTWDGKLSENSNEIIEEEIIKAN